MTCFRIPRTYIMHIPRTCFRIGLLLVALILITTLFRIGVLFGPVAHLIAIEAWLGTSWPCRASLAYITLG